MKRLAKQFDQEATNAQEWERRATDGPPLGERGARERGPRPKARIRLTLSATLKDQWTKQKTAVDQLKKALRLLNDKIEEAKRKRNVLVARKKRAEAQRAIQETMSGLRDQSAFETFDRMSQKIDQLEAEAEAESDLAEEYSGDTLSSRKFQQLMSARPRRRRGPRRPQAQDGNPPTRGSGGESSRRARSRPASRLRGPRSPQTQQSKDQEELAAALEELEAEQQGAEEKRASDKTGRR